MLVLVCVCTFVVCMQQNRIFSLEAHNMKELLCTGLWKYHAPLVQPGLITLMHGREISN